MKVTQWTPWVSKRIIPKGRQHTAEQQVYFGLIVGLIAIAIFSAVGAFLMMHFR